MAVTCPACNKSGQDGPVCARCACDLACLQAVRAASQLQLALANDALRKGACNHALSAAAEAWHLEHSPAAARLAFLAAAALGDSASVLHWHHLARHTDFA